VDGYPSFPEAVGVFMEAISALGKLTPVIKIDAEPDIKAVSKLGFQPRFVAFRQLV